MSTGKKVFCVLQVRLYILHDPHTERTTFWVRGFVRVAPVFEPLIPLLFVCLYHERHDWVCAAHHFHRHTGKDIANHRNKYRVGLGSLGEDVHISVPVDVPGTDPHDGQPDLGFEGENLFLSKLVEFRQN